MSDLFTNSKFCTVAYSALILKCAPISCMTNPIEILKKDSLFGNKFKLENFQMARYRFLKQRLLNTTLYLKLRIPLVTYI